LNIKKSLNTRR